MFQGNELSSMLKVCAAVDQLVIDVLPVIRVLPETPGMLSDCAAEIQFKRVASKWGF
jgi:hypothetical protein